MPQGHCRSAHRAIRFVSFGRLPHIHRAFPSGQGLRHRMFPRSALGRVVFLHRAFIHRTFLRSLVVRHGGEFRGVLLAEGLVKTGLGPALRRGRLRRFGLRYGLFRGSAFAGNLFPGRLQLFLLLPIGGAATENFFNG